MNAAVKRLAADKTRFDEQKSELIKGVEAKYAKILEERDLMFRRRVEEVRNSLNAQMMEAEVSVLEKLQASRRLCRRSCGRTGTRDCRAEIDQI